MPEFIVNLFVQFVQHKSVFLFLFFENIFRVLDVFVFHVNAPWQMLTVFVTIQSDNGSLTCILCLCIRLVVG